MDLFKLEEREIVKAKVKPGEVTIDLLETLYNEPDDRILKIESSRKYKMDPHEDLVNLMDELKGHLAVLSGYSTELTIDSDAKKNFVVTGYSIGGEAAKRGVVLIGYRKVMKSRQVQLNTPFLRFTSDQETYKYITQLDELIDSLNHEMLAYLDGKFSPNPQLEMELTEEKGAEVVDVPFEEISVTDEPAYPPLEKVAGE